MKQRDDPVIERMARDRIVPVVVVERAEDAAPVTAALRAGDCGLVEFTLRTPVAFAAITAAAARTDMLVGAGTVLDVAQVKAAAAAGACFIVSPGLDPAIVEAARTAGLPVIPGVSTATEIQMARNLGLRLVKFFPARSAGGAAAVRALAAAFQDMRFLPTGGIGEADLRDYLMIPTVIACGGSWLAPAKQIAACAFGEITRCTLAARAIARSVAGTL